MVRNALHRDFRPDGHPYTPDQLLFSMRRCNRALVSRRGGKCFSKRLSEMEAEAGMTPGPETGFLENTSGRGPQSAKPSAQTRAWDADRPAKSIATGPERSP